MRSGTGASPEPGNSDVREGWTLEAMMNRVHAALLPTEPKTAESTEAAMRAQFGCSHRSLTQGCGSEHVKTKRPMSDGKARFWLVCFDLGQRAWSQK